MRKIALYITFVIIPVGLSGQVKFDPEKTYYDAEFLSLYKRYKEALPLYLQIRKRGTNNANIDFKIGATYLQIPGNKYKGLPYLEQAAKSTTFRYKTENSYKEKKAPVEALMYLGQAYQVTNQLDLALEKYQAYKKRLESKKKNPGEIDRLIESCQYAKELQNTPGDTDSNRLSLPITDTLPTRAVFSSSGNTMIYMTNRKYYQAIYFTKKILDNWIPPVNITMQLESDGKFEINSLSTDGTTLLLSYYNSHDYDIYISNFINGRWERSVKLDRKINSLQDEIFAALSPNKETLFFASNRKGGLGGFDLYESAKQPDGSWGTPENMGPVINTAYDENSPNMPESGVFYFSSSGNKTMGGYDVFVTKKEAGNWTPPENPGPPLNTTDDDLYFQPINQGFEGYLTRFATSENQKTAIYLFHFYSSENPRKIKVAEQLPFNRPQSVDTTLSIIVKNKAGEEPKPAFTIHDIYFNFDLFTLDEAAIKELEKVKKALHEYPGTQVVITGHTDAIGSSLYNLKLSLKRARSILTYLQKAGINTEHITVIGKGESEPAAKNKNPNNSDNPVGRKFNRRASFSFTGSGSKFIHVEKPEVPQNLRFTEKY